MFKVTTTPHQLHMRQGAGTKFDSIDLFKKGTVFTALTIDSSGTWIQVKEIGKDGKSGWCSARYLLPVSNSDSPWLAFAFNEIGIKEYLGDNANHPRIQQYLATVDGLSAIDKTRDETALVQLFYQLVRGAKRDDGHRLSLG